MCSLQRNGKMSEELEDSRSGRLSNCSRADSSKKRVVEFIRFSHCIGKIYKYHSIDELQQACIGNNCARCTRLLDIPPKRHAKMSAPLYCIMLKQRTLESCLKTTNCYYSSTPTITHSSIVPLDVILVY